MFGGKIRFPVANLDHGLSFGLGLGSTHSHRILMKKILAVTVAIDVEVEGAVQPRAHRSQDTSGSEPSLLLSRSPSPYLLLRPLRTRQHKSSTQKIAPAAFPHQAALTYALRCYLRWSCTTPFLSSHVLQRLRQRFLRQ